ncbi:OmpH family outer membrane protein [Neokomagataea anthophila]|uniref:OmpH family outer membrane protein n=1 Tax=Neokomagataea anthophila TaxID=2826925 RepID=A0ABS5E4C9_9PROT|nr:OmpH family outer membrane protein [Neokomagataea anthophila]MBR0558753.1 OmpH family outer membrane protein [Neokomagataea anthophila]
MTLTSLKRTAKVSALLGAFVGTALGFSVPTAQAQSANGGWFVPKSAQPEAAPRPVARHVVEQPAPMSEEDAQAAPEAQRAPPVLPLPPVPTPPVLAKSTTPPPVVVGVINVQAVMQMSSAQQEIQQVLGARRDRLAQAVQHEEAAWREEAQKLQAQARGLSADQIQLRERHLQERRAKDQREFGNQARILQEAAQVAYHQIERELEQPNGIIASVAGSHGMNLVLHSEQVVLHVGEHDITDEVIAQLNKTLSHVYIPADGVDPEQIAKSGKMPTTADEERSAAPEPTQAPAENGQPQSVLRQSH